MSDTVRVLFVAGVLSGVAVSILAWHVTRSDGASPDRLIGQLRLSRWAAVLLASVGAISIGLAIARQDVPLSNVEAAIGVVFVGLAGLVLQRDPREGLLVAAIAFVLHALFNIAHRPGWLAPDVAPHWYTVGCATYDVFIAGLCYWTRRQSS